MDKLNDSLSNVSIDLKVVLEDSLKKILSKISTDYGIEYEELLKKYISQDDTVSIKKKKKKSVELPDSSRCIANTAKYTRCTKSKLPGMEFCGFHKNKQQYGVVKYMKETIVADDIEYIVNGRSLYMKEKLEHLFGSLQEIDFSTLTIDCDGTLEEDGSISFY